MVVIKCNAQLDTDHRRELEINIHDQAADGVIVLPHFCELLDAGHEDRPDGGRILILQDGAQADRVAELEQELARAMYYISAQKECTTCKYDGKSPHCCADCMECRVDSCRCRYCEHGSLWEWRGLHG